MRSTSYFLIAAFAFGTIIADAQASSPLSSPSAAESEFSMYSAPVTDGDLSESRGAFTPGDSLLTINNTSLNGSSSNNINIGGVTGSNQINGGSFTNTQGLVNVIQNSGNNVLIQSSTIVNMTMIGK